MINKIKITLLVAALTLGGFVSTKAAEVPQSRQQVMLSFAPLVKQSAPAVVNIYTKTVVKARPNVRNLLEDPLFKKFFGDRFSFGRVR